MFGIKQDSLWLFLDCFFCFYPVDPAYPVIFTFWKVFLCVFVFNKSFKEIGARSSNCHFLCVYKGNGRAADFLFLARTHM